MIKLAIFEGMRSILFKYSGLY